ncbi:VOC family protein [Undibacterium arcticum]|uniref:VOC family protein n=1 Tax=Undibacterium arcticum TaxID=1762892 RepID=A0ABV7F064_9BURK
MQKISPCLWFDQDAEQAANFYVSIFRNSRIVEVARFPEGAPRPAGMVMTVRFILDGQEFLALNGGPEYTFSPAISMVAYCETQRELDDLWEQLSAGGAEVQCGWLQDKFGVSWQIVPTALPALMSGKDVAATQRAMAALLQMKKLDIAALQRAYNNS